MGQGISRALNGKHVIHSIKDQIELPFFNLLAMNVSRRVKRLARTDR